MPATAQQQLLAVSQCGRPWAEQAAQLVLLYNGQLKDGRLSYDQYSEHIETITLNIDKDCDDPSVKELIVKAIDLIR